MKLEVKLINYQGPINYIRRWSFQLQYFRLPEQMYERKNGISNFWVIVEEYWNSFQEFSIIHTFVPKCLDKHTDKTKQYSLQ